MISTSGTCFTSNECSSQGGVADGGCAQGFGVCCSFTETCDSSTSQNGTYFISPATGSLPSVCSLLISPVNDNICQVIFNTFVLLTNKIHSSRSGSTLKRYRYRIPMRTETATLNTSRLENMKIIPTLVVSPQLSSYCQKTFENFT